MRDDVQLFFLDANTKVLPECKVGILSGKPVFGTWIKTGGRGVGLIRK